MGMTTSRKGNGREVYWSEHAQAIRIGTEVPVLLGKTFDSG
jgi:hypothetical protein